MNAFAAKIFALVPILGLLIQPLVARPHPAVEDEKVIRKVVAALEEAWNRHDMKAWAALFAQDSDFVNVAGAHWQGRAEIESKHEEAHRMMFRESTLTIEDAGIKFLRSDVALAHVTWGLVGDKDPDGTPRPSRRGIFTLVLAKQDGNWLMVAAQNTNIREPARPR
jgi:uncharacterized protein (TIGR02246 family)